MDYLQAVVLALIQGLTEFLPVSSSAHLILVPKLLGWQDQGLAFDVATHLGTLLAVLIYFRAELGAMLLALLRPSMGEPDMRRLALMLMAASLPALLIGYFAAGWIGDHLRDARVIAVTTLVFGVLLWLADRFGGRRRSFADIRMSQAITIGLAQALALVPGTSRSGVTITMGRALGIDATSAARFSFLLSIPVIAAAGAHGWLQVAAGETLIDNHVFLLAMLASAATALVCLKAFLWLLGRVGLGPFIVYRLLLGLVLLWLLA